MPSPREQLRMVKRKKRIKSPSLKLKFLKCTRYMETILQTVLSRTLSGLILLNDKFFYYSGRNQILLFLFKEYTIDWRYVYCFFFYASTKNI